MIRGVIPLAPMLLTTARTWPASDGWVLEPKWDGFRMVAAVDGGVARCWTRHGTRLTAGVSEILEDLATLPDDSIVDGELVALVAGQDGRPGQDFTQLSAAVFGRRPTPLCFVIFDAPRLRGEQLAARPWHERRAALESAITPSPTVSLIDVFDASPAVHTELLQLGFEGSVLKRRDSRYRAGQRSQTWRKLKTRSTTAAVIEVAARDRASGVVERIGCRTTVDPYRLTWAVVWSAAQRRELTRDPTAAVGRAAEITYTHRTAGGVLREARLTQLH